MTPECVDLDCEVLTSTIGAQDERNTGPDLETGSFGDERSSRFRSLL